MAQDSSDVAVTWRGMIAILTLMLIVLAGILTWIADLSRSAEDRADQAIELALGARTIALTARPDPFTGRQGNAMEASLIARDQEMMNTLRRECELTQQKIEARFRSVEKDIDKCHRLMSNGRNGGDAR